MYKPHLATDADLKLLKFPVCVLPKLDGVRGVNPASKIVGRSLKPFANPHVSTLFDAYSGFDGELTEGCVTDSDLCRRTTSAVNTKTGEPDLHWNLFDIIDSNLGYLDRYNQLLATAPYSDRIKVVTMRLCHSIEELEYCETEWLTEGYEGIIIRDPYGLSKKGRSTVLEGGYLRIKRFIQEDALVIGFTEGETNLNEKTVNELGLSTRSSHQANKQPNGMIGSLQCIDIKTGDVITVSPGKLTATERKHYFNRSDLIIGRLISYKHFPHGVKDKPRFPTFEHFRIPEDQPCN